jgi:hypothetical protein
VIFPVEYSGEDEMRASFQGPNVVMLGNGIAKLQMPPLELNLPKKKPKTAKNTKFGGPKLPPPHQ